MSATQIIKSEFSFSYYLKITGLLFTFFFSSVILNGQDVLKGVIKSDEGEPLPGATVQIRGTNLNTVSDVNGIFSIQSPEKLPFTMLISFVGHQNKEIRITELQNTIIEFVLLSDARLDEIVVTSRRRTEAVQDIPIPISVVTGALINDAGAFNVNRIKELVPTVQFYSSNPRNTTLNIRGLGSTFGLTNDGLDPGVGFYVDGVYYARPAATTLDFVDVERIEVLRGPQGTLFGKNTTSGALNITTKAPSFTPGGIFELSYGNYGFIQAKGSVTAPLVKNKLAARVSFAGTHRDGTIYNVRTEKHTNTMNNLGAKGQLLFTPNDNIRLTLGGDYTRQRPDGYAQVFAGVVKTQRADFRQFDNIISDLGYDLPTRDPFDRVIDHDTPWKSGNDHGGAFINLDVDIGPGTLTSTTAYRYWWWDPSNDRDFTGLQGLRLSQAPSVHNQWSQEVRYAGEISNRLSGVAGVYFLAQDLKSNPFHTEEAGKDQWRFSQNNTNPLWETSGLLDGYGIRTTNRLQSVTTAFFAQADWNIVKGLHVLPGIRLNYDSKEVEFKRETYGGLDTEDPDLLAIKRAVYNDQEFQASVNEFNPSGQLTVSYDFNKKANVFATYSYSFKPVGINLGGLPRESGRTMLELSRVEPEKVNHFEIGAKTTPLKRFTLNGVFHFTEIKDYQTVVQTPDLSVNRGYLANAERVRVLGFEVDANVKINQTLALYGSFAYTDGKYVEFTNAPPPLEEVGGPSFKDVSGGPLPGISKYAFSLGGELSSKPVKFIGQEGRFFIALESYYRSGFSSSPSPSEFLNVDGYALLNSRIGYKTPDGLSLFFWGRNLLDKNYFEFLLPGAGSPGHFAAVLGDPITFGGTLRYAF